MTIKVLHFDDCPHYQPTVELIEALVREMNVPATIEVVNVNTLEEAVTHRFLGSPTVQVDGLDVEPNARRRTDFAIACRRYDGTGVPSKEMVISALHRSGGRVK